MFIPVLLDRYAGIKELIFSFGQPATGDLLKNMLRLSVPARVEVPEAMKRRRGEEDWMSSGANVYVMMCVPVTLTSQVLFHIVRMVIFPEASCWSSEMPGGR